MPLHPIPVDCAINISVKTWYLTQIQQATSYISYALANISQMGGCLTSYQTMQIAKQKGLL